MKKKIVLLPLLFFFIFCNLLSSCQIKDPNTTKFQVDYLSHRILSYSDEINFGITIRNKSSSSVSQFRFIFETTLNNNKVVVQENIVISTLEANSARELLMSNKGYLLKDQNTSYRVSEYKSIKLVAIIMYDENENELGKSFFPSITISS